MNLLEELILIFKFKFYIDDEVSPTNSESIVNPIVNYNASCSCYDSNEIIIIHNKKYILLII